MHSEPTPWLEAAAVTVMGVSIWQTTTADAGCQSMCRSVGRSSAFVRVCARRL